MCWWLFHVVSLFVCICIDSYRFNYDSLQQYRQPWQRFHAISSWIGLRAFERFDSAQTFAWTEIISNPRCTNPSGKWLNQALEIELKNLKDLESANEFLDSAAKDTQVHCMDVIHHSIQALVRGSVVNTVWICGIRLLKNRDDIQIVLMSRTSRVSFLVLLEAGKLPSNVPPATQR